MDSVEDAYPLNATHRGILFHSLQCEEADVYLSVISIRIKGTLDTGLLQQAWQHVFSHHSILRSGVVFDGLEEPLWVVHKSIDPEWDFIDFTSHIPAEFESRERDVRNKLSQTQFKFAAEPLMKFTLITLDDDTHQLLWTVHHILSDGWSTFVVLEDLTTAYAACVRGDTPSFPAALDYGRFLHSQSKLNLDPLKAYWSAYLQGRGATPFKLSESVRDPLQVKRTAIETQVHIYEIRSRAIAETARRFETTSNVLLLAAWGFVLRDLCQHESPLFGVTLSGRSAQLSAVERGVGLYASTLPLFIDTTDKQQLKDWLGDIGKSVQAHAENDALALVDIQKLAQREANEPLFSSVVALAGHESDLCFGSVKNGIQIDSVEYQIRSHFDVSLLIKPGKRTSLNLISQTDKLDKASNEAILKRYVQALDLLVDSTIKSVSEFRLHWNQCGHEALVAGTNANSPSHRRIDEWIIDVAKRQPSSLALVQGDERLTYVELEQKARRISEALDLKVDDKDRPIAISLSNSLDAIVAMIGVLLSGRFYLPLDPQQPTERQALLCQDAFCAVIIVENRIDKKMTGGDEFGWWGDTGFSPLKITMDSLLTRTKSEPSVVGHPVTYNEQSRAYLMYTSGSTGKPKGVVISHANLIYSTQARFDYYPNKVKKFLLVSPLHFDSSVVGLYWTLCSGGTIVLPEQENRNELARWSELISAFEVSHVLCLPSVYRLWISQSDTAQLESLECAIVAGEPCDADLCSDHYHKLPSTELYNEYGPTEACVWSSVHRCRIQEPVVVPIGQPIPGASFKIVGIDGTVCPDGVEGELQVFSRGVAEGYHNRPELTAQSFSSNPSSYKTGDLGFRSRDGQLFCTGRIDRQIKIRGQRIEPAEVELVARRVEGVSDVRAFATIRSSGCTKQLWLAYTPQTISVEQIKFAVQAHLPEPMWPHGYFSLDSLPTLSNGKVSEQKLIGLLPGIDTEEFEVQSVIIENELEIKVLGMVNALLGEDKASIVNNAVQCGLDSIDAMKLTAQLREQFEIDLRLASVLGSRNWGELTSQIELLLNTSSETVNSATASVEEQIVPLSAQQFPLWFLEQSGLQPEVYAVQSTFRCVGQLSVPAVEYAVNALVHQHEILRTRLRPGDNGDVCQVVLPPDPVECTTIDRGSSNLTWEMARDKQLSKRFDLARDQLLRLLVYQCSSDEHLLMFHSHHIAMDGWSFDVLHACFDEHYRRYSDAMSTVGDIADQSITVNMPVPDEYQYRDFTQWQKCISPRVVQSDTEHWCRVLAEPRETLELPLDFARPARPGFKGGSVVRIIDPHIIECWSTLARDTQATPFMVALAAVKTGLRSVLGASDLLIGTPVSNRAEPRWQNMLGFFGNTVVIRTKSVESDTLVGSVQQTRAAILDALQHENAPFDQIVRSLGLQGSMSRHPLFDVFFIYKHQHESVPNLPGVNVELVNQSELNTAKFDLAIEIRPTNHTHPTGYELHLNYSEDLFRAATIERLAVDLLSAMSVTAQTSDEPLLEIQQSPLHVTGDWLPGHQMSDTESNDGAGLLINQRLDQVFHSQCLNSPSATALRHNGLSINYAELDKLVDRIAQCLSQAGIGPGEVVAVSLPRCIHQIAVALAVLRCDAVWCPIDPDYPQVRKSYLYSDSGSRFLIASPETNVDEVFRTTMLHIIVDPAEEPANLIPRLVALGEKKRQVNDVAASQYRHTNGVAVLMYTSGSTGKPKGVLLSHHAMMNRFVWMWNRYPFASDDVNVIKTSCSFVDSLWESFGALLAGVPSVLIDDSDVTDIESFLTALRINKVTRVLVVPSLLTTMLDWLSMYDQLLPDLRLCSCSGEVLPAQLAARFLAQQPHTRILNLYGSTEVAADVTCQEIVLMHESVILPIGTAIKNISMHILDEQHRLVVPGESGEIAFAGLGLAVGYHGDAELTAQKFIELEGVGRVFLTGDIGYIDNLGRLHFKGRKDRQVKVRGVRVNCNEIELQINSLPSVANSLVFAQGELEERHLCAVVQKSNVDLDSETIDEANISKQLKAILPAHQLPDRYRLVGALPMLANGKADQNAAAALMGDADTSTEPASKTVAKGTDNVELTREKSLSADIKQTLEKPMLRIWQDILNNHKLTVDDDFFETGGFSLLAVKLVMRVNAEILAPHDLQMTIGDLLEKRTVSNIAEQQGEILARANTSISTGISSGCGTDVSKLETRAKYLMTLQAGTGLQKIFMVPPFGDTGFFFRNFASCFPKKTSVFSFDMSLSVNHDSVQSLCSALVDELLVVQPDGPWVIVAGCLGNILALEMAHQLKIRTGSECDLYLIDSNPPKEGPGWKRVRERRTGLNLYWAILRKELSDDFGRELISTKIRKIRAVFDAGIRKYLDVQISQSNQYLEYISRKGSADITFFRSSTFMKKPDVVERWSLLTTGKFKIHDFPKVTHENLLKIESAHWLRITRIVLQSRYLQSIESVKLSTAGRQIVSQKQGASSVEDKNNKTLDIH